MSEPAFWVYHYRDYRLPWPELAGSLCLFRTKNPSHPVTTFAVRVVGPHGVVLSWRQGLQLLSNERGTEFAQAWARWLEDEQEGVVS